jgi:hypothetical protein
VSNLARVERDATILGECSNDRHMATGAGVTGTVGAARACALRLADMPGACALSSRATSFASPLMTTNTRCSTSLSTAFSGVLAFDRVVWFGVRALARRWAWVCFRVWRTQMHGSHR